MNPRCISLSEIFHRGEPEQCIAFECDAGGIEKWKHMAAAEVKWGGGKSNDRDNEKKERGKTFPLPHCNCGFENQDLISPTQRGIIVGVGLYGDAGPRLIQRPGIVRNHYQLVKCLLIQEFNSSFRQSTNGVRN